MAFLDSMGDDWTGEAQAEPTVETTEDAPEITEVAQEVPEQEPAAEAETAEKPQTVKTDTEPHSVPYSAMKKERERAQAAERELERLRAQVPPTPRQSAPVVPDPYEDPQGYDMHVSNQIAQAKWELRAEMSGQRAETMYGKETVEQAIAWAQEQGLKDPTLGQRVQAQNSPVEYVVQQYQQSRTLETIAGRTFEEAAKDYATQQGWIVSPEAQPSAQQQSSSVPPRSLARVPGSGSKTAPSGADWGEIKFPLG